MQTLSFLNIFCQTLRFTLVGQCAVHNPFFFFLFFPPRRGVHADDHLAAELLARTVTRRLPHPHVPSGIDTACFLANFHRGTRHTHTLQIVYYNTPAEHYGETWQRHITHRPSFADCCSLFFFYFFFSRINY